MNIAVPIDYHAIAAGLAFPCDAFIGGRFVPAQSRKRFDNINPATGRSLGAVDGGYKRSGSLVRDNGTEAIQQYLQTKTIWIAGPDA